jgi:hypothetical protein
MGERERKRICFSREEKAKAKARFYTPPHSQIKDEVVEVFLLNTVMKADWREIEK